MAYVLVTSGIVVQKQPNEQDFFIAAPDWVVCGYLYADGVFSPPDPPTPQPPAAPVPFIYAMANLQVVDQDITGLETAVNLAAAIWMDVGQYLVLFSEAQPDTSYQAQAYSGTSQAFVVEKGADYLVINATDASGPFDPAEFSITIIRAR